jgi:hypothetical protein
MSATRSIFLAGPLLAVLAWHSTSLAQSTVTADPAAYVDLQLKSLSTLKTSELQNSRDFIAHQIAFLPSDQQMAITSNLLSRLNASETSTKFNAAGILAVYPTSWSTPNTDADARAVYAKMLNEGNASLKTLLDSAIANAKGLYRDGIRDLTVPKSDTQKSAESKLRNMATNYPKSQYAENASFYLGLAIANQYILGNHDPQVIHSSNKAFEEYINRAQEGQFVKKDFFAAGYFFRGVNGWIENRDEDAINWMNIGARKFSDDDSIYVYQIILSPGNKAAVIDRYLPARSSFNAAIKVLSSSSVPQFPDFDALTKALQTL